MKSHICAYSLNAELTIVVGSTKEPTINHGFLQITQYHGSSMRCINGATKFLEFFIRIWGGKCWHKKKWIPPIYSYAKPTNNWDIFVFHMPYVKCGTNQRNCFSIFFSIRFSFFSASTRFYSLLGKFLWICFSLCALCLKRWLTAIQENLKTVSLSRNHVLNVMLQLNQKCQAQIHNNVTEKIQVVQRLTEQWKWCVRTCKRWQT